MKSKRKNLREVYVWQVPVRIFHWLNAVLIVILCITGYIIGNTPSIQHATAPAENYWFGWVRLTHLVCAMLFVVNFATRVYWAFAGNRFARWNNFIPITREQWRSIFQTTKVDIFLLSPSPIYDIGHNSLAATTYFGLFLIFLLQSLTGFCMFVVTTNNIMVPFFNWCTAMFGGFFVIRYIHHALMWLFIIFSIIHIYLVFYHDYIERNGIASSMIGGWKFIGEKVAEEYEIEQQQQLNIKKQKKSDSNEQL